MPIDTLKAARRLEELGFEEHQAEGLAELLSDLDVASATKDDLDDLEGRLVKRMDELETRVGERMDELETRVGKRMDGLETRVGERLNEQESRFEERLNEQEARFEERLDSMASQFEERFGNLETRFEKRFNNMETQIEKGLGREREGRIQLEKNLTERIKAVEKETSRQIAEAKNTLLIAIISCAVLITGILSLVLSYTA